MYWKESDLIYFIRPVKYGTQFITKLKISREKLGMLQCTRSNHLIYIYEHIFLNINVLEAIPKAD